MSRIHEALRKAELQRATTQMSGGGIVLPALPIMSTPDLARSVEVVGNRPAHVQPEPTHPPIRFEDLLAQRSKHPTWTPELNTDVFSAVHKNHGAEEFRTLRSRLYQLRGQRPLHVLLVTSSMAGEGKTFVSSNLVRSIVRRADQRALVIDADLRRPRLHSVLGAGKKPGLSDYLRGTADETAIIQFGTDDNLCLIPSGDDVSNPSELLANGRFKMLLDRMKPVFDWIIIDSPPCLPVADAGMMASVCDGVLLVVRAGFTPSAVIQKSRQELKDKNVVGVVLNAVADDALGYGSYHGYGSNPKKKYEKALGKAKSK